MSEALTEQMPNLSGRTVLLVEDNGILALNIEEMLRELGAQDVCVGASVAQSMPFVERGGIDFAILDFDLGHETSEAIALRLAQDKIPFVLASGYGDDLELPPELAGTPILKKPYMIQDIKAAIPQL